jgi:DNA-binding HxlR family transcriptional regulator
VHTIHCEVTRYRQFCALARAAEVVGERWTLLVVRELLLGPKRFADLQRGLTGISPALLTERLVRMEEAGLIRRASLPPPASIAIYELTMRGQGLRPAVIELIRWGGGLLFPPRRGEVFEPEWIRLTLEACARSGPTPEGVFRLRVVRGRRSADIRVTGGPAGTRIAADDGSAGGMVTASVGTIFMLASGATTLAQAVKAGQAAVAGDVSSFARFPLLFDVGGRMPALASEVERTHRRRSTSGRGGLRRSRRRTITQR